jgi:5-methylcytosine-specific restriction endonuclease McrA
MTHELLDFIQIASSLCRECVLENEERARKRVNDWNYRNQERLKESQKKYENSEKGAFAVSKRGFKRKNKLKIASEEISWEEKMLIGKFYKNCPQGYEVDHIIPVSKGGRHMLSNLQYLTREENRRKSDKINWIK